MLNIQHLLLLGVLSAALHWLLARAEITRFAWSRAPRWLDKLLRCPACSGWWLGLGLGALGLQPVAGVPHGGGLACAGLLAVWLTPVFEAVMLWGLEHSAVAEQEPAPTGCRICDVNGWTGYTTEHRHCVECGNVHTSQQCPACSAPACWGCGALLAGVAVPGGACPACNTVQGSVCTVPSCANARFRHTHAP